MLSIGSARTRAAASSIASGMPSSRWQICRAAGAFCSVSSNEGLAAFARSMNSCTASNDVRSSRLLSGSPFGHVNDGTR